MIVYHGSSMEISEPDVFHSRVEVDFGRGFYTTPLREQAEKWCQKFLLKGNSAIVNQYTFDETALTKCRVRIFDTYSEEWLNFIMQCRRGNDTSDYDIVAGGVANDKVFNTVELCFQGLIDKSEAVRRLRFEKPNAQIAFRTQSVMEQYLFFERSYSL